MENKKWVQRYKLGVIAEGNKHVTLNIPITSHHRGYWNLMGLYSLYHKTLYVFSQERVFLRPDSSIMRWGLSCPPCHAGSRGLAFSIPWPRSHGDFGNIRALTLDPDSRSSACSTSARTTSSNVLVFPNSSYTHSPSRVVLYLVMWLLSHSVTHSSMAYGINTVIHWNA